MAKSILLYLFMALSSLTAFGQELQSKDTQEPYNGLSDKTEQTVYHQDSLPVGFIKPLFQGGDLKTLKSWVAQNIMYPQFEIRKSVQGEVVVSFIVERDGKISIDQVIKSPSLGLSNEVVQVLKNAPEFTPAFYNGSTQRYLSIFIIKFTLQ